MYDEDQQSISCSENSIVPDKGNNDPGWEINTRYADMPRAKEGRSDTEMSISFDIHDPS